MLGITETVVPVRSGYRTYRLSAWFRDSGLELIVFVHGLACSKRNFRAAWTHAGLRHRSLLALDLPGFGRSHRPTGFPCTLEAHAEVLGSVIDTYALRQIHLVAHSMGGSIATLLATQNLARLESLVLVEPRLLPASCGVSGEAAALPFDRFTAELLPRLKRRFAADPRAAFDLDLAEPEAFHTSAGSMIHWTEAGKLIDRFRQVPCRKLFVYGAENRSLPELQMIPVGLTRQVPDAGHFVMEDNPAGFYAVLTDFVDAAD